MSDPRTASSSFFERVGVVLLRALRIVLRLLTWPLRLIQKLRRAPLRVVCFRGYGTGEQVVIRGRLVDTPPIRDPGGGRLARVWTMLRRLSTPPVPRALVRGACGGRCVSTHTDTDGLFTLRFEGLELAEAGQWQEVRVAARRLRDGEPEEGPWTWGRDEILIPSAGARLGIISDIDDTVVHTGVANKLAMMWRLFATEAGARVAFPGVGELYRALHRGEPEAEAGDSGAKGDNPIFYVSRGPWSIYPVLDEFFARREIPVGPILLLRDWGIHLAHPWPRRAEDHKRRLIDELLETYPALDFVLIGDSGQHDPEIYLEATERWGARIVCSYIREVTGDPAREAELRELARRCAELGSEMVLAADTATMAEHAAGRGFIVSTDASAVRSVDEREREEREREAS